MTQKFFLDSDVILDVGFERPEFFQASFALFTLAETGKIQAVTSGNCIANVYYILRKKKGDIKTREFLTLLCQFVQVLPITHDNIITALASDFSDFEDAIQHACAIENNCDAIITRNLQDYKTATIAVYTPEQFLISNKG